VTAPTQEHPSLIEELTAERPRPRPPIDPRIRERRIEVIRAAGRRRLHVTLVIASAVVVLGLAYLAVHSPLLNVDHVRISGARREPASVIKRSARVGSGDALPLVDIGAVARRIERLPWVAHARVRREYPGTLAIEVTEYVPTAYMRIGSKKVALIASTGRVIAYSKVAPLHVVQVVGDNSVPAVGARISQPEAANALHQLPPRLRGQVHAIDISRPDVVLELRRRVPGSAKSAQIRIGTFDNLADKGPAALAVLDHLGPTPFTYIDVSAPQAPVSL
jgi:cell division protein FtsQ